MDLNEMTDGEKLEKIRELYQSLSNEGKDRIAARLLEDEDLMGRLLGMLLERNEDIDADVDSAGGFIDFLRRVREE